MRDLSDSPVSAVPLQGDLRGSQAGDAYAACVDELKRLCANGGIVAITSASRGEGKSTTAANLALAIAVRHEPVLLIDLSLHRPALETIFGKSPLPQDMHEVLRGAKSLENVVCTRTDIGLHLAMLRHTVDFPVKPETFTKLLSDARAGYKWVLLDCIALADPNAPAVHEQIRPFVDVTVLVVQERRSSARAVKLALEQCKGGRTCVLLNRHG